MHVRTPLEDFGHGRWNRRDERNMLQEDCDPTAIELQFNRRDDCKLACAIHDKPRGDEHE